jgi:hypothetical protein
MRSVPEGEPLIVLARPSKGSHEPVQPAGVDEPEGGQIDDHMRRMARLGIELTVEQSRGGLIERAAQPEDQHVRAALGADGERTDRGPLGFWASARLLASAVTSVCVSCMPAPSVGLTHETVTGG